jgi:nucleoside-diphosphate-sugar epimerase
MLGAIPTPVGEPPALVGDPTLLKSIGFTPEYDLDRGLRESVEWWSTRSKSREFPS